MESRESSFEVSTAVPDGSKCSTPISGTMQDVELSRKRTLQPSCFNLLNPWFALTNVEYGHRCKAALLPYLCIDIPFFHWVKESGSHASDKLESFVEDAQARMQRITGSATSNSSSNSNSNSNSNSSSNSSSSTGSNTGSTSTRNNTRQPAGQPKRSPFNPFSKGGQREQKLQGVMVNETSALAGQTAAGCEEVPSVFGCNVDTNCTIYKAFVSMGRSPDLFGTIWINVISAGSIFSMNSLHKLGVSKGPVVISLSTLFALIILCLGCSATMASLMFAFHFIFTRKFDMKQLIGYLCVCGYVQIPLAIFCKLVVWLVMLNVYFPDVKVVIFVFQFVLYMYMVAATSCTLCLTAPRLDDESKTRRCRAATVTVACIAQLVFLTITQTYLY